MRIMLPIFHGYGEGGGHSFIHSFADYSLTCAFTHSKITQKVHPLWKHSLDTCYVPGRSERGQNQQKPRKLAELEES